MHIQIYGDREIWPPKIQIPGFIIQRSHSTFEERRYPHFCIAIPVRHFANAQRWWRNERNEEEIEEIGVYSSIYIYIYQKYFTSMMMDGPIDRSAHIYQLHPHSRETPCWIFTHDLLGHAPCVWDVATTTRSWWCGIRRSVVTPTTWVDATNKLRFISVMRVAPVSSALAYVPT